MSENLDRRAYDLLRLIDGHGPIGSIRLVDLLRRHGYSIKDRTVRLMLSDLDEAGFTEKISGKGRRLTPKGRSELERGHVSGRLEQVRERITTLTGQVTYDPIEDTGEVVACAVDVHESDLQNALDTLSVLNNTPLDPVPVAVDREPIDAVSDEHARVYAPSSITLDGVLLSRGINIELQTAGIVEYHPDPDPEAFSHDGDLVPDNGGAVLRYIDAISGEGSTMDVTSLLIEAGRPSIRPALDGNNGGASDSPSLLVVDNREYPLTRYDEAEDLAVETRDQLGGVIDIRKPREDGPFPSEKPSWEFASMTYGAVGELVIALLVGDSYADSWETLYGLVPRSSFEPLPAVRARES
ncbi:NrpR regulatory domain-containing protein [Halorussus salinisoli]|uniref:NrpR regulatory domain-containing protein n=1 Tax=Halorussus salinisoli TaxID=2558242 RepID=UPI0010C161B1|nr:NrpR regulatory domain-containing protein [Halorussus salinisoli]